MHTYVYAHAHTLTHFLSLSLFAYARCLLDVIVMDLTLLALSYLIVCSVALAGFSHTLHQKKKEKDLVGKTLCNYNFLEYGQCII